jgi:hypothetical protein
LIEQHEILSVCRRDRCFGVCQRESEAILIDDEEHIVLVHEFIIPHTNINLHSTITMQIFHGAIASLFVASEHLFAHAFINTNLWR